jgi:hypothetical protein
MGSMLSSMTVLPAKPNRFGVSGQISYTVRLTDPTGVRREPETGPGGGQTNYRFTRGSLVCGPRKDAEPFGSRCRIVSGQQDAVMPKKYDPATKEGAGRMIAEHVAEVGSVTEACELVGAKLGSGRVTLRGWARQAPIDGRHPGRCHQRGDCPDPIAPPNSERRCRRGTHASGSTRLTGPTASRIRKFRCH